MRPTGAAAPIGTARGDGRRSASGEELEDGLRRRVGLREHGGAGLDEDVEAGELGGRDGDVDIDDAARCGFEVGLVGRQQLGGETQSGVLGTIGGAMGGELLDGQC